ncbi:uncharacterized protein LDX57_002159 [Aspergillus melleus]|uniref:uncharacterized protein n=1 Tax=Aspergillus melleus TaxID=138277 RepID=UPI001E8D972E|nr:uncharacterized protein LDX57_002159 [Aspergillus melleus]KAH8424408.1 hypothetical protein LDX57_002159 [Aspergillus melleus]
MTGKDLKNNVRSKLHTLFRKGDQKHNKLSDNDSEVTLFPLSDQNLLNRRNVFLAAVLSSHIMGTSASGRAVEGKDILVKRPGNLLLVPMLLNVEFNT